MTSEPKQATTIAPEGEERELCPNCLTGNVPGRNFCIKCGAPLSSHAAIGPFERIFAEGYIYRTAAERPHKFIMVLGIWCIFGPLALIGVTSFSVFAMPDETSGFDVGDAAGILLMLFVVSISATLIVKTTWNYIAWRMLTRGKDHEISS